MSLMEGSTEQQVDDNLYVDDASLAEDEDEDEQVVQPQNAEQSKQPEVEDFTNDQSQGFLNDIKLRKSDGEVVLKLTELFRPTKETQDRYQKHIAISKRVSGGNEKYQIYLRSQKEFKAQLAEEYKRLSQIESRSTYGQQLAYVLKEDPDFEVRNLESCLRCLNEPSVAIDSDNQTTQSQIFDRRKEKYYNVSIEKLSCDLPDTKLELPSKRERPMVALDFSVEEQLMPQKQPRLEAKPLYANDNLARSDAMNPSKIRFMSNYNQELQEDDLIDIPEFNDFYLEWHLTPVKPTVSMESGIRVPDYGHNWGEEFPQSKPPESVEIFKQTPKTNLFGIQNPDEGVMYEYPTRVNSELQTSNWLQLAMDPKNPQYKHLADSYNKIVINTQEEAMEVEEEQGDYGEDDFGDGDVSQSQVDGRTLKSSKHHDGTSYTSMPNHPEIAADKTRITSLEHAYPAYEYMYNKTSWTDAELRKLHRPDLWSNPHLFHSTMPFWYVKLMPRHKRDKGIAEMPTSFQKFKKEKTLSIAKNKCFSMIEYVEERPHSLSNFGMASIMKKYVRGNLQAFPEFVGKLGITMPIHQEDEFPLIGKLNQNQACTLLENNLYKTAVFNHKAKSSDYLLVIRKQNWYLRPIQFLYTAGQNEPKKDVFTPKSRTTNHFKKLRTQAYIYRKLLQNNNLISINDICLAFPDQTESNLKKQLPTFDCEVTKDGYWRCKRQLTETNVRDLITPENICQYESMKAGEIRLQDKGISITTIEKLPYAIQKLLKEVNDQRIKFIASQIIENELTITPWNLTSNYISTRQQRAMMRLEGIGDPTNGHGGYSFVKLPLKLSQSDRGYCKDTNPYMGSNKTVTGTDADLRKLSIEDLKRKLADFGESDAQISTMTRWERVARLRQLSSKKASQGYEGSITKYARGFRRTTKMQQEEYHRTVNDVFQKQIKLLGRMKEEYYSNKSASEEEIDESEKEEEMYVQPEEEKKLVKYRGFRDDESDPEAEKNASIIDELKQVIPDQPAAPSGPQTVLRRVRYSTNPFNGTITKTVEYTTDKEEIDNYRNGRGMDTLDLKVDGPKVADTIDAQKTSKDGKKKVRKEDFRTNEQRRLEKKLRDEKRQLEMHQKNSNDIIEIMANGGKSAQIGKSKTKCSVCGMYGHMKTNRKLCPMSSLNRGTPESQFVEQEGSKLKFSLAALSNVEPEKPVTTAEAPRRSRREMIDSPFEDVAYRLMRYDHSKIFIQPVRKEQVPDYYNIILNPMDLQKIHQKAKRHAYETDSNFMDDIDLMVANAERYNGPTHQVSDIARGLRLEAIRLLKQSGLYVEPTEQMEVEDEQLNMEMGNGDHNDPPISTI